MFCPNCGSELTPEGVCPLCNTSIEVEGTASTDTNNVTPAPEVVQEPVSENSNNNSQATPEEKVVNNANNSANNGNTSNAQNKIPVNLPIDKINKEKVTNFLKSKNFLRFVGVVFVFILLVFLVKSHKTTIKLDKYVTVEFEGYDTLGKATARFDWEKFEKDYGKKIKLNKSSLKKYLKEEFGDELTDLGMSMFLSEYLVEGGGMELFKELISGSLDKSANLSNGDVVTYTWKCDDDIAEFLYHCKLKYKDNEFKTIGLEQVGTFNPFDGATMEFYGIAPDGNADFDLPQAEDYDYYLRSSLDKDSGLSNGDTVTVTISISGSEESFVEKYGKLPNPTEQTYTVDGLMAYIDTAADIPDGLLSQMQSQAEDIIKAQVAKQWKEEASLSKLEYIGNYYLKAKNSSSSNKNKCALVYKITAAETMDTVDQGVIKEDVDIYYYVQFKNLMTEEDGNGAVDISNYDITNDGFDVKTDYLKESGWWTTYFEFHYNGYESLDKLYNEIVTKNLEEYSHEDNVSE